MLTYVVDFHRSLEEDLKNDTSGHFECLLVSQVTAARDESLTVDHAKAEADARALIEVSDSVIRQLAYFLNYYPNETYSNCLHWQQNCSEILKLPCWNLIIYLQV